MLEKIWFIFCVILDQDLKYQLPYYDCVPDDPSFDDMRILVCDQKKRPEQEDTWLKYEVLYFFTFRRTFTEIVNPENSLLIDKKPVSRIFFCAAGDDVYALR